MSADDVHTYPVNDLIEHVVDGGDCPCGPASIPVPRDDGSMGWQIQHHSLDGRELRERGQDIPKENIVTKFQPIKGTASDHYYTLEEGVELLNEEDQEQITELLMGRRVVKVDDEHLLLDDGTTIKAIGHDGGCACSAGCYDLSVLNGVDNIITRVEYDYAPAGDDIDEPKGTGYYRIFVFADAAQINLMQFDGSDGNGYYGTGFAILVRRPS